MACAALPARADSWIDDERLFEESPAAGGSYIAQHFNEAQFTGQFRETGQVFQAQALAVAVAVDYSVALDSLRNALDRGVGIQSITMQDDINLARAWDERIALDDGVQPDLMAKWQRTLAAAKIKIDGLTGARIWTKIYNRVPSREGFSQAKFLVFDGMQIYGKSCTLVVAYRADHAKQWGFRSIHDLSSFWYEMRLVYIVTNTESKVLEALPGNGTATSSPVLIPFASSWYDDPELWIELGRMCAGSE